MVNPTVKTPPLQPPTSPQMARSTTGHATTGSNDVDGNDDGDDYFGASSTRPLLPRRKDKSEIIQDILASNNNNGDDDDEARDNMNLNNASTPRQRQAYPNTLPDDQTCVCHTAPLASFLCCLAGGG